MLARSRASNLESESLTARTKLTVTPPQCAVFNFLGLLTSQKHSYNMPRFGLTITQTILGAIRILANRFAANS